MSNYRSDARRQLQRAKDELASSDVERLKYAALELREAMESLTYDRALAYKDDFPPSEYETWQPKKVMQVLLEIDPNADKDSSIAFGIEPSPGQTPELMQSLGTEKVLNMKMLKKHYDALGSYLHVQSMKQRRTGVKIDFDAMRTRCEAIAVFVEDVLKSKVFNSTLGIYTTAKCVRCAKPVRKKWPDGKTKINAKCFECGADYIVEDMGDGECSWQADRVDLACANLDCGAIVNPFRSEIAQGSGWDCRDCGGRNELRLAIVHLGVAKTAAVRDPDAARETTTVAPDAPKSSEA
jgi:DNA-directed RNA polymerase subunit RPC12/RpoP